MNLLFFPRHHRALSLVARLPLRGALTASFTTKTPSLASSAPSSPSAAPSSPSTTTTSPSSSTPSSPLPSDETQPPTPKRKPREKKPKTPKTASAKRGPRGKTAEELLEEKTPSKTVVARLRTGTVTTPKEHWVPLPVRPQSPNIVFFKEVSRGLSERWKALSKEERDRYTAQAREDKDRFRREVAEFFGSRTPEQFYQQKLPTHLKNLDPLKPPKAPSGPYALFVKNVSAGSPELGLRELSKVASARWKVMTAEEKQPWTVKATEAKQAYLQTVEEFLKKLPPKPAK